MPFTRRHAALSTVLALITGTAGAVLTIGVSVPATATPEAAAGSIRGTVTDAGCNPVSVPLALLRGTSGGSGWEEASDGFTYPDADGTFSFTGLAPGRYVVRYGFNHPRFEVTPYVVEYSGDAQSLDDATPLHLKAGQRVTEHARVDLGGQITGNVGDRDGWAVPYTTITAELLDESGTPTGFSSSAQNPNQAGEYTLWQLPAGAYRVSFTLPGHDGAPITHPEPVTVEPGVTTSEVSLRTVDSYPPPVEGWQPLPDPAPAPVRTVVHPAPEGNCANTPAPPTPPPPSPTKAEIRKSLRGALDSVRLTRSCRWSTGPKRHRLVRMQVRRGKGLVTRVEVRLGTRKLATGRKTPFRVERRAKALRRIGEPVNWRGHRKIRATVRVALSGEQMRRTYVVKRPRCLR